MSPDDQGSYRRLIEMVLEHGGTIELPYKQKLNDWFTHYGIRLSKTDGKYKIWGDGGYTWNGKGFDTLDEALEEFEKNLNNAGALQEYIRRKHPHVEQSGDMDWDELKRLVRNERSRRKRLRMV